ncbi:MAG: glycosyltransferase family 9 protein, partial [Candidatus Margulisbacteria bacterium]|nr:glycosyltransferase family 9 protein [Candidatus Margulisiibacteriota bacterium]
NDFQRKLAGLGIAKEDFLVGIHPGCISSRAWDEDKFALVIEGLQNKFQAKVVLTGGPQERAKGEKISSLCRQKPVNLIEKTTIPEMMALIKRLNIYIGADTGPTHIAAALGTPVLLIILGKNVKPVRWGSYNSQHLIIYAHPQAKCPLYCDSGRCKETYCSQVITPEIVLSAAQQLREGKSHDRSDWQRLSLNVCLIFDQANKARAEKVALELDNKGYHAVLFESKDLVGVKGIKRFLRLIETENILVLHQLGKKHAFWTRLANLLSGIYTTNATVLAKGYTENEDLLKKYSETFQKSLF